MTKPKANSKRPEKLAAIQEIDSFVAAADFCFILNYGGLTVAEFAALRGKLAEAKAVLKVVKNTYLAKALEDKGWTAIESVLSGPTALVAGAGDPAEVAKAIKEFLKGNEKASVKAGQLGEQSLSAEQVKQLADLPSKDEMRAKLLATLQAPAGDLVRVLSASIKGILYVLKARVDKEGPAGA